MRNWIGSVMGRTFLGGEGGGGEEPVDRWRCNGLEEACLVECLLHFPV